MDKENKNTALFLQLVSTYEMTAMMAMGKIKNPVTDKTEKDLEHARFAIDMLDMIIEKTKGNLNDEENRFIQNISSQLKLNFVQEIQNTSEKKEEKKTDNK
jgi:hypothetical protein